jgi:nucleotide-binding universal stress UspA family protein
MSKAETVRKAADPRDVVVGVDYSADSERALYAALQHARSSGAPLHVLAVAEGEGPPLPHELTDEAKRRFLEEAHATLDRYVGERVDALAASDPEFDRSRIRTAVDFGDPAERILALADGVDAELIVIGPRGKTGMERLLVGSVADQVLRHARCSVLIARARGPITRHSMH